MRCRFSKNTGASFYSRFWAFRSRQCEILQGLSQKIFCIFFFTRGGLILALSRVFIATFKSGENFEFIVKSVKKSSAKKDVEKWSIEGTYYPEVPMEPVDL